MPIHIDNRHNDDVNSTLPSAAPILGRVVGLIKEPMPLNLDFFLASVLCKALCDFFAC